MSESGLALHAGYSTEGGSNGLIKGYTSQRTSDSIKENLLWSLKFNHLVLCRVHALLLERERESLRIVLEF